MAKKQVKELLLSDYVQLDGIDTTGGLCISAGLSVIDGSYYQTTTPSLSNVFNFSSKNSYIQAEEAFSGKGDSYGPACTGTKGYCILSVDGVNSTLKLSGDISKLIASVPNNYYWSYSFGEAAGTSCLNITEARQNNLSSGIIKVPNLPSDLANCSSWSEESCIWRYDHDDNGIYCPTNPTIGNYVLSNFFGNHAEGGSVKAIGKYTHAEGRGTTADIRYAHAEGSHTFAGGMAAHAEGIGSPTNNTLAMGQGSHAEGGTTKAIGKCSHTEGVNTLALGA